MFFEKAKPIWAKEYVSEKNIVLSFKAKLDFNGQQTNIKIAADALYRLTVNGEFLSHGPQRCGRGFWRVDTINLTDSLKTGTNEIEVLVARHGVTSFEYVMQNSFLQAEVLVDGKVALFTDVNGDFEAKRVLSREQVVERYSTQDWLTWTLQWQSVKPCKILSTGI